MARRSRSSQRDGSTIASFAADDYFAEDIGGYTPLSLFEDLRSFHPEGPLRGARAYSYGSGLLVDRSDTRIGRTEAPFFSGHVGFAEPDRVFVCQRRKERRQVLMALGRGGGGGSRKRRRNRFSDVRC